MKNTLELGEGMFNDTEDFNEWSDEQARLFSSFIKPVTVIETEDGRLKIYYTEERV